MRVENCSVMFYIFSKSLVKTTTTEILNPIFAQFLWIWKSVVENVKFCVAEDKSLINFSKSFQWNKSIFYAPSPFRDFKLLQKYKFLEFLVFKKSWKFRNSKLHDEFPKSLIFELKGWNLVWTILVHPLNLKWYRIPASFHSPPPPPSYTPPLWYLKPLII